MKIYIAGSSKNKFLKLDNIREKYFVNKPHNDDDDNIDKLNKWYCEITALYYMWKHSTEDIVGLEHYRRYFINNKTNKLLSETDILKLLESNDIIMYKYNGTNALRDAARLYKEIALSLAIVNKYYGSEISSFIKNKIKNSNYVYEGNMFICKKELIDEYCEFLFKVLSEFDKIHKFKTSRIDGYIAEYLFGPWMEFKKKKIYNCKRQSYSKDLSQKLYGHV